MMYHESDAMAVMYLGLFTELADTHKFKSNPHRPYNQGLLSPIPVPDREAINSLEKEILEGDTPVH